MPRTNKCKICGWTGPKLSFREAAERNDRNEATRCWVGTNHNLCSMCAPVRTEQRQADPNDWLYTFPPSRLMPLAALAALAIAPTRRTP
jgi:hypothetical protein